MIVIIGSRDLWPTPNLASAILTIMVSTEDTIGVRSARGGAEASMIEAMVTKIAARIGRPVHYFSGGTSGNWHRDNEMARYATQVYAFFAPGQLMEGGTGHVVNVALREGVPVRAFELDAAGNVVEAASDEGSLANKEGVS